jgi:hypothetical protein
MRAGQGPWSSEAPCRSRVTPLALAFLVAMARATGSMSWADHPGRARVEGRDAGHPAPAAQIQDGLLTDPGGLSLDNACQELGRRPDGRPEGDRLLSPTLLFPGLPQGNHVWGVMGHEVRPTGHRGQRGQPREQRGRGDRRRPEGSGRGAWHRGGISCRDRVELADWTVMVARRASAVTAMPTLGDMQGRRCAGLCHGACWQVGHKWGGPR